MIDLQVHTLESDGMWTLEEVLSSAKKLKITHLAITDHDSIDGWKEGRAWQYFLDLSRNIQRTRNNMTYNDQFFIDDEVGNLAVIQGEEVTCQLEVKTVTGKLRRKELHMLAYFLNEQRTLDSRLGQHNEAMKLAYRARMKKMITGLGSLGFTLDFDELMKDNAIPRVMTREYLAEKLLQTDYNRVKSIMKIPKSNKDPIMTIDVKNRLLGQKSPIYASVEGFYFGPNKKPGVLPTMQETVDMILEVGAVPVISHPARYSFVDGPQKEKQRSTQVLSKRILENIQPKKLIEILIACSRGLGGLEVYNARDAPEKVNFWLKLAKEYQLFYTAGTDFHGDTHETLGIAASPDVIDNLYTARDRVRETMGNL